MDDARRLFSALALCKTDTETDTDTGIETEEWNGMELNVMIRQGIGAVIMRSRARFKKPRYRKLMRIMSMRLKVDAVSIFYTV